MKSLCASFLPVMIVTVGKDGEPEPQHSTRTRGFEGGTATVLG